MMIGLTYLLNGYNQRYHGYSGKQLVDADWRVHYSKMTLAESCWFYSKWVKICWILWFSCVSEAWKKVRLSEEIPDPPI